MKKCIKQLLLVLWFYILSLSNFSIAQDTKQQLQSKKLKLEEEIRLTNKMLQETKKTTQINLAQMIILENKIKIREKLISTINSEIYTLDKLINDNYQVIKALERDLEELKKEYAKMIFYAYKNQNPYNILLFIFSAEDFSQAYKRFKYIQQYTSYRKKQAKLIVETQNSLNNKIAELENKKTEKHKLLEIQENEQQQLNKEKQEKANNIQQLQKRQKELLNIIREKENEAKKLKQAIEAIIAKEIEESTKKAKQTTKDKTENVTKKSLGIYELTPEEQTLSDNFAMNKGKLPWPVERGIITSSYGQHSHPILENIIINNNGIDIGTTKGAKVRAVFDGKVTGVINLPGSKAVIIRHGEYLSVYSNLQEVFVKSGDKVTTKQYIGTVLTNEDDGKTELHFEIWQGKNKTNPEFWLTPK